MRATRLHVQLATFLALALCGCSEDDDSPGGVAGIAATGGALAPTGGIGGGSGGAPMPGMNMMQPQPGSEVPTGGMSGGSPSGAGAMDSGAPVGSGGMAGMAGEADAAVADSGEMMGADEDECGAIPMTPLVKAMGGRLDEYGTLEYNVTPPNELVALRTTMRVPEEPPPNGTVFLWPGIQPLPRSANYTPIRNGVLQPVLTWGPSCVPGALSGHDTWWISAVYVNISSTDYDYRGCLGGPVIETAPDRLLDIDMWLEGTDWIQTVHDLTSDEMTDFTLDLRGQGQARALFVIELPGSARPTEDLVFTKSVFSMKEPEPEACDVLRIGPNDYASEARISADGRHCCIDHIVLRAQGVPPSTMDP